MKFSGTVKDSSGHPRSGVLGITFALYKDEQGGAPLWLETQNVQADGRGIYTVLLGSTKAEGLPTDIFTSNEARWLGVQVEGQQEQPRTLLVSAPYALKAADAETLGGKPISAFQLAVPQGQNGSSNGPQNAAPAVDQPNEISCAGGTACKSAFIPLFTSNGGSAKVSDSTITQTGAGATARIGLGTTSPGARLDVLGSDGSVQAAGVQVSTPTFPQYLLKATSGGSNAKVWRMIGRGTNDFEIQTLNDLYGGEVTAMEINRSGTSISSVDFPNGNVGIGTVSPGAPLQVTDAKNPTFNAVVAADLSSSNSGAAALFGDATATTGTIHGVAGQIVSTSGGASAVLGEAFGSSGQTTGVQGFNASNGDFSAGATAVSSSSAGKTFGLIGTSGSPNGTGVWGLGQNQSITGRGIGTVGVWGDTSSNAPGAAALVGTADDAQALVLANNSTTHLTANIQNNESTTHNVAILTVQDTSFGQFCNINTDGVLFCSGGHQLVVPVDNNQHQVVLHAVESPQNWFEDFGSGRLEGGIGRIALEFTFAQTVNTGSDYHVFLTPDGECRGLYVSNKAATGFEVHELGGGQSNVSFSYRIVALRRGYETQRLEDETAMVAKMKDSARLPATTPARKFTLPTPPAAPIVPVKSNLATATR